MSTDICLEFPNEFLVQNEKRENKKMKNLKPLFHRSMGKNS